MIALDFEKEIRYIYIVHIYEYIFILMNNKEEIMNVEIFTSKINQKVLGFLCDHPNDSFYSNQIAEKVNLSKGGVNQTLRLLAKDDLLFTETKGKMHFYQANTSSPVIRQFKVFRAILALNSLIEKLRSLTNKIVLFGSCANGTNTEDSDIDLLVVSNQKAEISRLIPKFKSKQRIQLILKSPEEYVSLEKKEPIFFAEIEKGNVLWEKQ